MKITVFLLSSFVCGVCFANPVDKTETITVDDKLGTIKEERVQGIQSDLSYVPNGTTGVAYSIIDITDSGDDQISEHAEADTLSIPSWTLFSW